MSENWSKNFFNLMYLELFLRRTDEEIDKFSNKIIEELEIKKGEKVLDAGCGVGDIANKIAEKTQAEVMGIEQIEEYVEEGKKKFRNVHIVHGDLRETNVFKMFDKAYCWNTSWGYFNKHDDILIIENLFRSLKVGGKFALETINPSELRKNFKPKIETRIGSKRIIRSSVLQEDATRDVMKQTWLFLEDNLEEEILNYKTTLNLYYLAELKNLFKDIGFNSVEGKEEGIRQIVSGIK